MASTVGISKLASKSEEADADIDSLEARTIHEEVYEWHVSVCDGFRV
jgi:hypothetical protein